MPRRGELWWADLDPVVGRELGRKVRPAAIVSVDAMPLSTEKVVIVPSTTQSRPSPMRVPWVVGTATGRRESYFCCDDIRAISVERLRGRIGLHPLPAELIAELERVLRYILGLE